MSGFVYIHMLLYIVSKCARTSNLSLGNMFMPRLALNLDLYRSFIWCTRQTSNITFSLSHHISCTRYRGLPRCFTGLLCGKHLHGIFNIKSPGEVSETHDSQNLHSLAGVPGYALTNAPVHTFTHLISSGVVWSCSSGSQPSCTGKPWVLYSEGHSHRALGIPPWVINGVEDSFSLP